MKFIYYRSYEDMKLYRKILKIIDSKNIILKVKDIITGEEYRIFKSEIYNYNYLAISNKYYYLNTVLEYTSKYENEEYKNILEQFGSIIPEQFI